VPGRGIQFLCCVVPTLHVKEMPMNQTHDTKIKPESNPKPVVEAPGTHPVGTGLGAAAGAVAGGAIGTAVGGPVGTVVGGAAGAATGALVGEKAAEVVNPVEKK
jgi:hypothetical protein